MAHEFTDEEKARAFWREGNGVIWRREVSRIIIFTSTEAAIGHWSSDRK